MNIDLTRLRNGVDKYAEVNLNYSFSKEELAKSDVKSLDNVSIVGTITRDSLDDYVIDVEVKADAILTCAITLKDVVYPLDFIINDRLLDLYEESSINIKNIGNTIDIFPIIWENILMEIPTHVVSDGASSMELVGDGWKLNKESKEENSELSKLKDLL